MCCIVVCCSLSRWTGLTCYRFRLHKTSLPVSLYSIPPCCDITDRQWIALLPPTLNLVSFYSHSFFSQVWLRASWCLCLFKSFTRKNGPSLPCALECSGFGSALHVFLGWLVGFLQVLMPIWLTGGAGPRDLTLAHRAKNTASLCRDDCAVLSFCQCMYPFCMTWAFQRHKKSAKKKK